MILFTKTALLIKICFDAVFNQTVRYVYKVDFMSYCDSTVTVNHYYSFFVVVKSIREVFLNVCLSVCYVKLTLEIMEKKAVSISKIILRYQVYFSIRLILNR